MNTFKYMLALPVIMALASQTGIAGYRFSAAERARIEAAAAQSRAEAQRLEDAKRQKEAAIATAKQRLETSRTSLDEARTVCNTFWRCGGSRIKGLVRESDYTRAQRIYDEAQRIYDEALRAFTIIASEQATQLTGAVAAPGTGGAIGGSESVAAAAAETEETEEEEEAVAPTTIEQALKLSTPKERFTALAGIALKALEAAEKTWFSGKHKATAQKAWEQMSLLFGALGLDQTGLTAEQVTLYERYRTVSQTLFPEITVTAEKAK